MLMAKLFAMRYRAEETGSDVVGTGNDARLALLDQINDQNDGVRGDDFQNINDDGSTEAFQVQAPNGEKTALVDEAVHEEIIDHDALPAKHKIKVNGLELELTTDELIARAQKVEAADAYLKEASRMKAEAEAKLRQQDEQQVKQVQQVDSDEEDLATVRAIQMGSEEEALAAYRKLKQAVQPQVPSVNPADLARTIDERLTFNEAINKFRTEYADVVSDPYLNKMALDIDAQLLAQGDRRPYMERYHEVGKQVRGWVSKFKAPATTEPVVDKLARKAAVEAVPKAAAGKTATSVDEDQEESTADTIAAIAKSRGGPQWMSGMSR